VADEHSQSTDPVWPTIYQIRIEGHLGPVWTYWFDGLSITLQDDGDTLLTGAVVDQAALHGVLRKVRDLGVPLVSINRLEAGPAPDATDKGEDSGH
jgi:hypothetical protein